MKKTLGLFISLMLVSLCTSCVKSSSTQSDPESLVKYVDWEKAYACENADIISQEWIEEGGDIYIPKMEEWVETAVEMICEKMREGYKNGFPIDNEDEGCIWRAYLREPKEADIFDGSGFYLSTFPVTTYMNNLNSLGGGIDLYFFNEDMTSLGEASFRINIMENNKGEKLYTEYPEMEDFELNLYVLNDSYLDFLKEEPEREYVHILTYLGGTHRTRTRWLDEDNKLYYYGYDIYDVEQSGTPMLRIDKYDDVKVEGEAFQAFPEEMKVSYNKLIDNLIWVDYEEKD